MKKSIINILKEIVEFKSFSYNETELIFHISVLLKNSNIDYIIDYFNPNSYNKYAPNSKTTNLYIEIGSNSNDILILYFHTDIVYAPDKLFKLKIEDNKIYGRGTADMKSSIAGLLFLLLRNYQIINNQLQNKNKKLIIAFIADEETTGTGINRFIEWYENKYVTELIKKRPKCILFEPSNDFKNIIIGCRGYSFIKVIGLNSNVIKLLQNLISQKEGILNNYPDINNGFGNPTIEITKILSEHKQFELKLVAEFGVACHASRPYLGKNPIEIVLKRCQNVSFIISEQESAINAIPNICYYTTERIENNNFNSIAFIDIRTNLSAEKGNMIDTIISLIKDNNCDFEILRQGEAIFLNDKNLINLCTNKIQNNFIQNEIKPIISEGGNDSQQLIKITKQIIVSFGAGQIDNCHSDLEFISNEALNKTPKIIDTIIQNFINS